MILPDDKGYREYMGYWRFGNEVPENRGSDSSVANRNAFFYYLLVGNIVLLIIIAALVFGALTL